MQGIRAGESGHGSRYDKKDDRVESSWGPFQLNRRGGLGAEFEKDTGLSVRDPSTIAAQARWVAGYIRKNGIGIVGRKWMGYRGPRDANPNWGDSGYAPSAAAGVHDVPGAARGAHSPMPYPSNWNPIMRRGSAFEAASGAGVFGLNGPTWQGSASLDVRVKADGSTNVKADGGDLFKDVNITRGRSMVAAQDV
jgi:hypothetical protein